MDATVAPQRTHAGSFDALWVPCGAASIETYEACVRAGESLLRATARAVRYAPAQRALSRSAELTRDIGATHASWARWSLGL